MSGVKTQSFADKAAGRDILGAVAAELDYRDIFGHVKTLRWAWFVRNAIVEEVAPPELADQIIAARGE